MAAEENNARYTDGGEPQSYVRDFEAIMASEARMADFEEGRLHDHPAFKGFVGTAIINKDTENFEAIMADARKCMKCLDKGEDLEDLKW